MSLRDILSSRLRRKFGLKMEWFSPATGWYRTSPTSDVYRWEAWGILEDPFQMELPAKYTGQRIQLASYDTMTECSKKNRQLQLCHHSGDLWNHYEVSAVTLIKVAAEES